MKKYTIKSISSRLSSGKSISSADIQEVGMYPVYGGNGVRGYSNDYNFDGECVIIGRQGAQCGNVKYFSGKAYMTEHAIVFVANNLGYTKYIYYLLSMMNLGKLSSQSAQPGLSVDTIGEQEITLPSIEEQKKRGDMLFYLDNEISNNKRINDNLQHQIQTLYDYWFTQFEFPDKNGKPYKSNGGKMVWSELLKQEIPENWAVQSLTSNSLSSVIKNGVDYFDKKEYIATANVLGTEILDGEIIDYANRESRANMQPTINSVWFAKMKNSIKHLFLNKEMQSFINNTILSTGFLGLQCSDDSFEYIASYISNPYFEYKKDTIAHGATQQAVNNVDLNSVYMPIPDNITLLKYHNLAKGLYSLISKNLIENKHLVKLRDWLLPMLMNGQATIAD